MRIRDLMTRSVATVRPADTARQAAREMRDRGCGCVPVVESGKLVGIVTDRDLVLAALRKDEPLSRLAVEEAMTRSPTTCGPDATVEEAERLMGLHQVRRLPVVDAAGRLIGLLSLDDLATEARYEEDLIRAPVSAEGIGRTLGQIDRPHLIP